MYFIKNKSTVHSTLNSLKSSLSPSTIDYEFTVQRKYNAGRAYHKRQNFEAWSRQFQQAYVLAVNANLPKISSYRAQKELLQARDVNRIVRTISDFGRS